MEEENGIIPEYPMIGELLELQDEFTGRLEQFEIVNAEYFGGDIALLWLYNITNEEENTELCSNGMRIAKMIPFQFV